MLAALKPCFACKHSVPRSTIRRNIDPDLSDPRYLYEHKYDPMKIVYNDPMLICGCPFKFLSVVTGQQNRSNECNDARKDEDMCGPRGKWWERRDDGRNTWKEAQELASFEDRDDAKYLSEQMKKYSDVCR